MTNHPSGKWHPFETFNDARLKTLLPDIEGVLDTIEFQKRVKMRLVSYLNYSFRLRVTFSV